MFTFYQGIVTMLTYTYSVMGILPLELATSWFINICNFYSGCVFLYCYRFL